MFLYIICRLSAYFEHIWSLKNLQLTFFDNKSNLAFQKDTLEKRSFFGRTVCTKLR